MTVLSLPATRAYAMTASRGDPSVGGDGTRMQAQCRHQATVVTISGAVDTANGDRVHDFATRFVRAGNGLILDLCGIDFFSARGISVLLEVDDLCRAAEVPWAMVPSLAVSKILRLTACDPVPTASSVPAALRHVLTLIQARRRITLATNRLQSDGV